MAPTRSEFVSRLFSRKASTAVATSASASTLFNAFQSALPDPPLYQETLQGIRNSLVQKHQFALTSADLEKIEYIFKVFYQGGPSMNYGYASATPNSQVPSYYELMTGTDRQGQNSAYLADEGRYLYIRGLQQKNLIVPVVGDFAGSKALKAVGKYLRDHNAFVSVFYISNVEDYLESSWPAYRNNIQALPFEDSAFFISFIPSAITRLRRIQDLPTTWPGRN
jgi:hypothetical protein